MLVRTLIILCLCWLVAGIAPTAVQAGEPLVAPPCTPGVNGCPTTEREAARYGTCEFVETIQNVLWFFITYLPYVIVLTLVVYGLLMIISGGGSGPALKLKSYLQSMVFGLLLVVGAYGIVSTIMTILISDDYIVGDWNQIQCVYSTVAVETVLENSGGSDTLTGGTNINLPDVLEQDLCTSEYLSRFFPGQERVAQCVLQGESNCGSAFYSRFDLARDQSGNRIPFSVSPWQLNLTVHEIRAGDNCRSGPLDCKAAFSGQNFDAVLVNETLYNQCIQALRDESCSGAIAQRIQRVGWAQWSAYRANGCGG